MQHHTHAAPRSVPHMRPHHMAMHGQAAVAVAPTLPHMTSMNLGPTPIPQPPPTQTTHKQSSQAPVHHLSNGLTPPPPVPTLSSTTSSSSGGAAAAAPPPPPHMREHHNRVNHQQPRHPQPIPVAHLPKIRHQNLNNIHNNGSKANHQHQQPQQYNHINAPIHPHQHLGATPPQQRRNLPLHLQQQQHHHYHNQQQQQHQPHHMPHMKSHVPHTTHGPASNNIINQQQQQQMLSTPAPAAQPHQYYVNNKAKNHNNNNNNNNSTNATNFSGPKSILQNPNRMVKPKVVIAAVAASDGDTAAPAANTVVDVAATLDATSKVESVASEAAESPLLIVQTEVAATSADNEVPADDDSLKEVSQATTGSSNSNSDSNNNNKILSNEDTESAGGKHRNEKTPMCLINELARFNKLTHQYRLTGEYGPAHNRRFTVTLKLGDEEFTAEGLKIKKAQHYAAKEAIEKTKYKHPTPKIVRRPEDGTAPRTTITPTVELNALAMKLGQQTYYLFDPRQMPPSPDMLASPTENMMSPYHGPPPMHGGQHMIDPSYMRRNAALSAYMPHAIPHPHQRYGQRGFPPKFHQQRTLYGIVPPHSSFGPPRPAPCRITLIVGKQKYVGIGRTMQQAKHDAASRALQVLKAQAETEQSEVLSQSQDETDNKSPISQVHEVCVKRNLTVHFKVLREDGPAHMRNFITACIVGTMVTEGEGNGKKLSKKRAAEKMLEELSKLPPLAPPIITPEKRMKVRTPSRNYGASRVGAGGLERVDRRKRAVGSIKEKSELDAESDNNPITKLTQLQQFRKEKEPDFRLIAKNGTDHTRRREFIMEVSSHGLVARGIGNNKRLAKRNAAQNLLISMGVESSTNPGLDQVDSQSVPHISAVSTVEKNVAPSNIVSNSTTVATIGPATVTTGSTEPTEVPMMPIVAAAPVAKGYSDIPLVATTAGHVPGILILRQNKRNAARKKDYNAMPLTILETPETEASTTPYIAAVPATTVAAAAVTAPSVTATPVTTPSVAATAVTAPSFTPTPVKMTPLEAIEAVAKPPKIAEKITTPPTDDGEDISAASTVNTATAIIPTSSNGVHMKDQLLYLSKLLGFEVNFSDYPKGNHNEFLTIVTLSTNPPQICHGVGTSSEESQNDAAKNALKILSELGLNNSK